MNQPRGDCDGVQINVPVRFHPNIPPGTARRKCAQVKGQGSGTSQGQEPKVHQRSSPLPLKSPQRRNGASLYLTCSGGAGGALSTVLGRSILVINTEDVPSVAIMTAGSAAPPGSRRWNSVSPQRRTFLSQTTRLGWFS